MKLNWFDRRRLKKYLREQADGPRACMCLCCGKPYTVSKVKVWNSRRGGEVIAVIKSVCKGCGVVQEAQMDLEVDGLMERIQNETN